MKLKKFFFTIAAAFFVFATLFLVAVFLRYLSWSTDPRPAEKLTAYFSSITKSDFQYRALKWHLLPFPTVRFSDPVFKFKTELQHELKANSLELKLNLTKLILGQFEFSGLRLVEGEWRGQIDAPKGIHSFLVNHIDLKTSALLSDQPVKIYMSGDAGGRRKAVVIHGELKLPPFDEPRLDSLGFDVQVLTRNFRFEDNPVWEFLGWVPSSGLSDFLIVLKLDPQSDRIAFSGDAGLHDLVFRSAEPTVVGNYKAGNLQVKFAGYFSPSTDELKFTQCSATLPFSQLNLQGSYLPHQREFRSMTFSFLNIKLDELPNYFPDFKNKIPYFIGFSGLADMSFSLSGFPSRLKIYGDMDLTRALFTYGRFFQKLKDKPFRLKTELSWENELLAGEFSGNLENLSFKGNLPEWRSSGELKVNLITNAFAAEQLVGLAPFLSSYDLGGSMKLFSSFEGKWQGSEPFQKMFHLNMKDGSILRKGTGSGFKDLNLDLDFGPLLMEAKAPKFSFGGSFFEGELKSFHPEKNPKWEGHLTSEKLTAANVWKEWKEFWGGENTAWLESLHPWVQKMILSEDPFESLKLSFVSENNHVQIEPLELRAFDGNLAGAFFSNTDEKAKKIRLQINSTNMDGARLFKFFGMSQLALEGRVNWKADLEGNSVSGASSLAWSGPVSLSLKNGVLGRFNYLQGFTEMDFLKGDAATLATASERIFLNNFDLSGRIENERFNAETIKLDSEQFKMDGEGDVSGKGILNFRLKTYLESNFFKQMFPKRAEDFISSEESYFGPVTLLASGPLDTLEFKPDPQSVAELAGRYARKKTEAFSKYL